MVSKKLVSLVNPNAAYKKMNVESYINKGNSFPIIVNQNGKRYFVKLRAGMSGQYALLNEWIGNRLGIQLGIKTQTPKWIELNDDLIIGDIYIEVKELINKSKGLNIGFAYQENSLEVDEVTLQKFDRNELINIFLFDLLMLNIDRTPTNINLMQVGEELISVDYESSLLVQEVMTGGNLWQNARILQCFRNNPFYHEVNESEINYFLATAENINIKEILQGVPATLLKEVDLNNFIERMEERKSNGWYLREIMLPLKTINVESKAAQKQKANKNQAKFRKRFDQ